MSSSNDLSSWLYYNLRHGLLNKDGNSFLQLNAPVLKLIPSISQMHFKTIPMKPFAWKITGGASADSSLYLGEFNGFKSHGLGFFYMKNDIIYFGQFEDGIASGNGILIDCKSGLTLEGTWNNNVCEGECIETLNGKIWYIGQHSQYKRNGKGTYYHPQNKYCYEGEFKDNFMNGNGILMKSNGDFHIGEFANGLMHGSGLFIKRNSGLVYQAIYSKDHTKPLYFQQVTPVPGQILLKAENGILTVTWCCPFSGRNLSWSMPIQDDTELLSVYLNSTLNID